MVETVGTDERVLVAGAIAQHQLHHPVERTLPSSRSAPRRSAGRGTPHRTHCQTRGQGPYYKHTVHCIDIHYQGWVTIRHKFQKATIRPKCKKRQFVPNF